MKARLKLSVASLVAAIFGLGATPGVAHASTGTQAFLTYTGGVLSATGNTVGWTKGTINIRATLYVGGTKVWDRPNQCLNTTYCTLPTYQTCPIHGYWSLNVWAWRGTDTSRQSSDSKAIVV